MTNREEWMQPISPSVSLDTRILGEFDKMFTAIMEEAKESGVADMSSLLMGAFLRGAKTIFELMPENVWELLSTAEMPKEFEVAVDLWENFRITHSQLNKISENPSGNIELN